MGCVSSTSRNTTHYPDYEGRTESSATKAPSSEHNQGYEADSEQSNDKLISRARGVYRESVLWHGTSMQSKIDLRKRGFDVARKIAGATEGASTAHSSPADKLIENAKRHNYLTSHAKTAKSYARLADYENPALIRTIGVRNNFNIELDPESKDASGEVSKYSCRTTDSIPNKYIVGSKHSEPGTDAKIFKQELADAGIKVSTSRAGKLLRTVQSDSEDDF